MYRKRIMPLAVILVLIITISCGGGTKKTEVEVKQDTADVSGEDSKDLIATMAYLPGLAETPDEGAFVDLVKAIDDVYTEGNIIIEIYPFARSVENIIEGKADFHVPTLRNPAISEEDLPYRTVTERMGTVVFVVYSHIDNIITRETIEEASAKGGEFPYEIDAPGGLEDNFLIPVVPSNDLTISFQKLQNKRIDAVLWAQEESDLTLRNLKLNMIWRSHYADFDDAIIIPKGPEGDETDRILSEALRELKASGRQEELYSKIHLPYDDWQPSETDW
jgi:polar amino acid transport system substrate-binding protein